MLCKRYVKSPRKGVAVKRERGGRTPAREAISPPSAASSSDVVRSSRCSLAGRHRRAQISGAVSGGGARRGQVRRLRGRVTALQRNKEAAYPITSFGMTDTGRSAAHSSPPTLFLAPCSWRLRWRDGGCPAAPSALSFHSSIGETFDVAFLI